MKKNKNENGMEAGLKITSLRDSSRSNTGHGSSDGDGYDLSNWEGHVPDLWDEDCSHSLVQRRAVHVDGRSDG